MTVDDIEAQVEAERLQCEPFAISKRMRRDDREGSVIDQRTGQAVMTMRELLRDPATTAARSYLPWGPPPDWPGVVMVIHPAAWGSGGPAMVDALAQRFGQDVHVFAHGSKWYMIFVGELADRRSLADKRRDLDDKYTPRFHDGGLYVQGNCQWWTVAHPDGTWENVASS